MLSSDIDYEHVVCYKDIIEGKLEKDMLAIVKNTHYRVILSTLMTEQRRRTDDTEVDYRPCLSLNASELILVLIICR